MWRGQEMCRYDSMEEFVDSHLEGVETLEKKQEDLLEDEYGDNTWTEEKKKGGINRPFFATGRINLAGGNRDLSYRNNLDT